MINYDGFMDGNDLRKEVEWDEKFVMEIMRYGLNCDERNVIGWCDKIVWLSIVMIWLFMIN